MKRLARQMAVAVLLAVVLPMAAVYVAAGQMGRTPEESTAPEEMETLTIRVLSDQGTVEMDMDTYLVGVVLAEMPMEFEPEALKAQAVVARTYALRRGTTGTKHGSGTVCTNPDCCQGYTAPEDYLASGGDAQAVEKVRAAVAAVSGQVLTYDGELIEATFFSCSGGSTEDAVAVWGSDVPYLQATPSPGEEDAAYYTDQVTFSRQELESLLGVCLEGSAGDWFCRFQYTDGGGVAEVTIGGVCFTGVEVRQMLSLRSTNFTVVAGEDAVTLVTYGYGHRVGMSQYGAQAMALAGSTYDEILLYYYQGVQLCLWSD